MTKKPTYEELEKKIADLEKKSERLECVEAEMKKNLRFTESLLLAIPMPVFFKDAQGRYMGCNKAFEEFLGVNAQQLKGKTVQETWPSELAEEYHRKDLEMMRDRRHQIYEFEIEDKNGDTRSAVFHKDVFYNERGDLAGLVGCIQDITEMKKVEGALRENEAFLSKVLEATLSGLYLFDLKDRRNVFVNPAYTELTGLAIDDIQSLDATRFLERFHADDRPAMQKHWEKMAAAKDGKVFEIEYRFLSADGRWLSCFSRDSVFSREPDGSVRQIIGAFLDISDLKLSEKILMEWNQNLENLVSERSALAEKRAEQLRCLAMELTRAEERERGRLACLLHDDLQQVLAAAKLNLTLLGRPGQTEDERKKKLLAISDMLDEGIRKTRYLSHELSPMTLSRNSLFTALQQISHDMMQKKLLTVSVEADPDAEPKSSVISTLLLRAAKELLFNVVKHSGVDSARLILKNQKDRISMAVEDRGAGCTLARRGKKRNEASGFGLISIEERLNLLGGRMKIETAPQKGFRVRITVPRDVPDGHGDEPGIRF